MWPPFLLAVLRKPIRDVVIVTFFRNKNVAGEGGAGGCIKGSHRYRRPILGNRIPE